MKILIATGLINEQDKTYFVYRCFSVAIKRVQRDKVIHVTSIPSVNNLLVLYR